MELNQLLPLKVERIETVFVKPSQLTPTHILSISTLDDEPNLEFLSQTIYVFKSKNDSSFLTTHQHDNVSDYQPNDPAYLIQNALSAVLVHYYPLAGKLYRQEEGQLRVNCTGDGVPFAIAETNCSLASLNYFERVNDLETTRKFVFDFKAEEKDESYHPLIVQVTKFTCGGFTLGMGISHSVFDGLGVGQFVRTITELASGKSEISVKPVWERERLVITSKEPIELPIGEGALAFSPYLPTTELAHESFNVYSGSIKRLKMGLMKESVGDHKDITESFTTLEALSAYIWRSRFRAFELNPDGKTILGFTVGIRKLLVPPLPEGYYGNAFVGAFVDMVGKDLNEIPLSNVARMIKESKKNACKTEYIWSWISLLEKTNQNGKKFEGNGATMMLTDWRQLGLLEQVDFGWGKSVNMIPVPWRRFGYIDLCMFMPPCSLDADMKGGVRVSVYLPRAVMAKFKEEMDALNKLEDWADVGQLGGCWAIGQRQIARTGLPNTILCPTVRRNGIRLTIRRM